MGIAVGSTAEALRGQRCRHPAVDLDRSLAELAHLVPLERRLRPEVGLDHDSRALGRQPPQQLHRRAAEPPGRRERIVIHVTERVEQRLLDHVLGQQWQAEVGGERTGERRLPCPGRSRHDHQPAHRPTLPGSSPVVAGTDGRRARAVAGPPRPRRAAATRPPLGCPGMSDEPAFQRFQVHLPGPPGRRSRDLRRRRPPPPRRSTRRRRAAPLRRTSRTGSTSTSPIRRSTGTATRSVRSPGSSRTCRRSMTSRLGRLCTILDAHAVATSTCGRRPGAVVYEDDHQVGVIPSSARTPRRRCRRAGARPDDRRVEASARRATDPTAATGGTRHSSGRLRRSLTS